MSKSKRMLITGGAGYIGSHLVKRFREEGHSVLVVDNLSCGKREALLGAELFVSDISDVGKISRVLKECKPDLVVHCAAFKNAVESISDPKKYFDNNISKSIIFLNLLVETKVRNIIFSSTAGVYGDTKKVPITEESETSPINPYSFGKLVIENILLKYKQAFGIRPIIFRYFNVAGTDSKGEIGNMHPNPQDIISNVMKAASGETSLFKIYGADYQTKDGTCVRDIIHIEDLVDAHTQAAKALKNNITGIFNLGTENGYSVKEVVEKAKKITGTKFETKNNSRRQGDIVVSVASAKKAKKFLGWTAKRKLGEILSSSWEWEIKKKNS